MQKKQKKSAKMTFFSWHMHMCALTYNYGNIKYTIANEHYRRTAWCFWFQIFQNTERTGSDRNIKIHYAERTSRCRNHCRAYAPGQVGYFQAFESYAGGRGSDQSKRESVCVLWSQWPTLTGKIDRYNRKDKQMY